jgi:hypothetical protein
VGEINACTILKGRDHFRELGPYGRDNIKIDCKGMECEEVDWIHLVEDRLQRWFCSTLWNYLVTGSGVHFTLNRVHIKKCS